MDGFAIPRPTNNDAVANNNNARFIPLSSAQCDIPTFVRNLGTSYYMRSIDGMGYQPPSIYL